MITLSQAFRLLDIKNEGVYLRTPPQTGHDAIWFWHENVRKFFDMEHVRVVRVYRHFSYSFDERDYELVVCGISAEGLRQIARKIEERS